MTPAPRRRPRRIRTTRHAAAIRSGILAAHLVLQNPGYTFRLGLDPHSSLFARAYIRTKVRRIAQMPSASQASRTAAALVDEGLA